MRTYQYAWTKPLLHSRQDADFDESEHPRGEGGKFTAKEQAKVEELHGEYRSGHGSGALHAYLGKVQKAAFKNRTADPKKLELVRWARETSGKNRDEHLTALGARLPTASTHSKTAYEESQGK
jgi:hypothetical protein